MKENPVLFAQDLDGMGCAVKSCDHKSRDHEMTLAGRCCGAQPTHAQYRAGVLTLFCSVCRRHVASLAVASRADAVRRRPSWFPRPGSQAS